MADSHKADIAAEDKVSRVEEPDYTDMRYFADILFVRSRAADMSFVQAADKAVQNMAADNHSVRKSVQIVENR